MISKAELIGLLGGVDISRARGTGDNQYTCSLLKAMLKTSYTLLHPAWAIELYLRRN